MLESSRSFLTGAARGALNGALIGAGVLFAIGAVVTALAVATNPVTLAIGLIMGGFGGVFGSLSITALVVGGSAIAGGIYKGVSDAVDMEEIIEEKEKMVSVAKMVNNNKIRSHAVPARNKRVSKNLPDDVSKDELARGMVEKIKERRAAAAANKERENANSAKRVEQGREHHSAEQHNKNIAVDDNNVQSKTNNQTQYSNEGNSDYGQGQLSETGSSPSQNNPNQSSDLIVDIEKKQGKWQARENNSTPSQNQGFVR